jgi:MFS family permease
MIYLTNAFFVLKAISLVELKEVTILLSILFLIRALFDFPSGIIGDWIGQRSVLVICALIYGLSYSQMGLANTFSDLVLAFFLLGIAEAMKTGSFFSWFDNTYKQITIEDKDLVLYNKIISRYGMMKLFILSMAFIIGAQLINMFNYELIFKWQSYLFLIVCFVFILVIRDYRIDKTVSKQKKSTKSIIKSSLSISWNNKQVRYVLLGSAIMWVTFAYWEKFLSIMLYKEIAKTDDIIGIVIALEFFIAAIITGFMGLIANRIVKIKNWLIILYVITCPVFFGGLYFFVTEYPIASSFAIQDIIVYLMIFILISMPFLLRNLLNYRLLLDIVPDENRSSVYSLLSTITFITAAIVINISGEAFDVTLENALLLNVWIGFFGAIIVVAILLFYKPSSRSIHPFSFFNAYLINHEMKIGDVLAIAESKYLKKYKEEIDNLSNQLLKGALEDSHLQEEELVLINQIVTDIQGYTIFLTKGKLKTQSKDEFYGELKLYKDKIWKNATKMAGSQISDESSHIFVTLSNFFNSSPLFELTKEK